MKVNNEFLKTYLEYVEDTESPRIFHIWAALSGISACLGRRCKMPFGSEEIYPNLYVLLVGPPAVKKSTAMKLMVNRLKASTDIRFAPKDTAGQRQGLIRAIEGRKSEGEDLQEKIESDLAAALDVLESASFGQRRPIDERDKHHMFACASEFTSFIGQRNHGMLDFLTEVYDGGSYEYQLKSSEFILDDPLLGIFGCTTPTNISTSMPPEAMGQGLLSRIILVYGDKKHKRVPRPKRPDDKLVQKVEAYYRDVYNKMQGEFTETEAAGRMIDELYDVEVPISDPRFVYYKDRRHTPHLIKLAMVLAASRLSMEITVEDVREAHVILSATEERMSDALGEFGLSPLSASKQRMIEFLKTANGPVSTRILYAVMSRDMKQSDFYSCLADLENAGMVKSAKAKEGKDVYITYVEKKKNEEFLQLVEALGVEDLDNAAD